MPDEDPSLRDAVAAAFDTAEQATPEPVPPPPDTGSPGEPPPAPEPAQTAPDSPESAQHRAERVRDERGRFAPKQPGDDTKLPVDETSRAAPAAKPSVPDAKPPIAEPTALRAPSSWKPEVREHWAKVPPEVQAEIHRREGQTQGALRESTQAREAITSLQQVISPFMPRIQAAAGGDTLAYMKNVFQTETSLAQGSETHRAEIIANLLDTYGIPVATLDRVLEARMKGQPAPNSEQDQLVRQIESRLDQRIQPIMGFVTAMQQNRQQAIGRLQQDAASKAQAFVEDPKNEFCHGDNESAMRVRESMADLIEVAHRRGIDMTVDEAYKRAVALDPELAPIAEQRASKRRADEAAAAAVKARRVASSLPGSPAPTGSPPRGDSLRAAVEAAYEHHEQAER